MVSLSSSTQASLAAQEPSDDRTLVWSDEFNQAELDRTKWGVIGTDFWVNNEQQAYVDDSAVLSIVDGVSGADGGALILRPVFKPGVDPHPERKADFLSGRVGDLHGKAVHMTWGGRPCQEKLR